jgi:hypothetical protein
MEMNLSIEIDDKHNFQNERPGKGKPGETPPWDRTDCGFQKENNAS